MKPNLPPLIGLALAIVTAGSSALAAPPTKDECVESYSRGQDLRERGHVADAKRLFLLCAQQACPALIQSDCARFGEELSHSLPSVSFSARDARGNDLPDARVTVDGQLVTSHLEDGKAYDLDPGRHVVIFSQGGHEKSVVVVLAVGDRGRNISAVIGDVAASDGDKPASAVAASPSRPIAPLIVAGVGAATLVTGGVLGIIGLGKVPNECSRSTNQCAAAPGSSAFDDAKSAVHLANTGLIIGIAGLAVGVTGLVWYLMSSPRERATTSAKLLPHLGTPALPVLLSF